MTFLTLIASNCLVLFLLPVLARSQTAAGPTAGRAPADVQLTVSTVNGRSRFQIGEIIPLKLAFTSSSPKKYQINLATYDRSGRMHYESFLIEPGSGWVDPLANYLAAGVFMMGGLTNFKFLSSDPTLIQLDMNEWVCFDRPGEYRVRIRSNRTGELAPGASYVSSAKDLISNELVLTIVPASREWQQETLKKAVAVLGTAGSRKKPDTQEQMTNSRLAVKTLCYLGTAEAAVEMARRLGWDDQAEFDIMLGLIGSPHHGVAVSEMRRLLTDPDHPVSSNFLFDLARLLRTPGASSEAFMAEDQKSYDSLRNELMTAVVNKHERAQALSLNTLLETGSHGRGSKPFSDQLATLVAASFDHLPVEKQREVLEYRWDLIKGPAFLPVVRKYAQMYQDRPPSNEVNTYNALHLSAQALTHWYELEPGRATAAILREIVRPVPRFSANVLGILPEKTLPEVEQALAENFASSPVGPGAANVASLLQRYASGAVLGQVLAVVDKNVGKWACDVQTPALAYLLRVDPVAARSRLEAAMAARGKGYSACNHMLLVEVGKLQQDPALEEIAVRSLDDDDPQVAGNAAIFLGDHGSAGTEQALWEHLIHWNETWHGRETELTFVPGGDNNNLWQANLGTNLILALATGKSWMCDGPRLQRLRQLAVDQNTKQEVDSMIAARSRPWRISYPGFPPHESFEVLQYREDSLTRLKEKLEQFPAGSVFVWQDYGSPAPEVLKEISEFLKEHKMSIKAAGEDQ